MYNDPYVLAFVLTVVTEGVVLSPWLSQPGCRLRSWVGFLGINAVTHGLLWSVFPLPALSYLESIVVCETLVVVSEAVALTLFLPGSRRQTVGLAVVANAVSTLVGLSTAIGV